MEGVRERGYPTVDDKTIAYTAGGIVIASVVIITLFGISMKGYVLS